MRFRFIEAVAKLRPTAFAIGKGGAILKRYVGEPEFAELHALLEKVLAVGAVVFTAAAVARSLRFSLDTQPVSVVIRLQHILLMVHVHLGHS